MNTLQNNAVEILEEAKQSAEQNVVGYLFIGAFGEALRWGYIKNTPEFDLFVGLFLNHLPKDIVTDNDNFIIRAQG